jgi:predicted transcriptional regulator
MAKARREIPPPLELLCLRALWTLNEGTVQEVRRVVGESRPLAYTTIMTVLERLSRKGLLTRRKAGRAFFYQPTESRDAMRRAALKELVENFFEGSEEALLRFLRHEPEQTAVAAAFEQAPESAGDRIDTVLL